MCRQVLESGYNGDLLDTSEGLCRLFVRGR